MKKIIERIRTFFENFRVNQKHYKLVIIRADGIPLYSSDEQEKNSIGALVGGVWHASRELNRFVPHQEDHEQDFRFSFDTTDTGVYILPLKIKTVELYMAFIFWGQINPGLFKMKAREMKDRLQTFLSREDGITFSQIPSVSIQQRSGYLFDNISDEEMDKLFMFSGNN